MKIKVNELLSRLESKPKYTEEYAYNNSGDFPVIDGSTQSFDFKLKIDTFDYDCDVISVSTVGFYAGHVNYYKGKFSVGNNVACYSFLPKFYELNLNPLYLVFKLFRLTKILTSGESGGYAALNTTRLENSFLEIDDSGTQTKIVSFMEKRESLLKLECNISKTIEQFEKFKLDKIDGNIVPVGDVIDLIGGSSALTEEFVYNHSDDLEKLIPIYTGSIFFTGRYVNSKDLRRIFHDTLKITRKGQAGAIMFIKGNFAINDDAYVVSIKDEFKDKVNIHFLHFYFLSIASESVSSECGNGTFNKTKFLKTKIRLPNKATQDKIGGVFKKYLDLIDLNNLTADYRIFLNKNISFLEIEGEEK